MDDEFKIFKAKVNDAQYKGILYLFVLGAALTYLIPLHLFGIPRYIYLIIIIGIFWFWYLSKAIPKCHKCGLGVLSVLEIKGIAIMSKPFVMSHCAKCGAKLKYDT